MKTSGKVTATIFPYIVFVGGSNFTEAVTLERVSNPPLFAFQLPKILGKILQHGGNSNFQHWFLQVLIQSHHRIFALLTSSLCLLTGTSSITHLIGSQSSLCDGENTRREIHKRIFLHECRKISGNHTRIPTITVLVFISINSCY